MANTQKVAPGCKSSSGNEPVPTPKPQSPIRRQSTLSNVAQSFTHVEESALKHQGMCKSAKNEAFIAAILNEDPLVMSAMRSKPAHLGTSKLERFLLVLWQFPKHCLMTNLMCIIPILVGSIPIALGALHASWMVDAFPNVSATYYEFEALTHARPLPSQILEVIISFVNNCSLYLCIVACLCCAYDYKIVLPTFARTGLPFMVLHLVVNAGWSIARALGYDLPGLVTMLALTLNSLFCIAFTVKRIVAKRATTRSGGSFSSSSCCRPRSSTPSTSTRCCRSCPQWTTTPSSSLLRLSTRSPSRLR
jgi:hypothetical protein